MKKLIAGVFAVLLVFGFSSMVNAYSYSFDVQEGAVSLHVADNCSELSITTTSDLIFDFDFDLPPEDTLMDYTASLDITLGLFGMFNYELEMSDLELGSFKGFDLTELLGDGLSPKNHFGSMDIDMQFGEYSLTDAKLDFDFTFTPDEEIDGRYALSIEKLTLSGGNTNELLAGIINDLNQSGESPITLEVPFTLPTTLKGAINLEAEPVPVPAAIWLFGSGILGMLGFKRRKKS